MLRPFTWDDKETVLKIASDKNTTKYLYHWGRVGSTPEGDTQTFLSRAVSGWEQTPVMAREYAVVLKETGEVMGDGSIEDFGNGVGEIGWILLPEYRGKGYVTEMGKAFLQYGFETLGLQKIIANCDARNEKSRRVMERLMMEKSNIAYAVRPAKERDGFPGDEFTYAITKEQYEGWQEAAQIAQSPCEFHGFMDLPDLTDGELRLVCHKKSPYDPVTKYVPAYFFYMTVGSEVVGTCDLRVGYVPGLYVGGNIGYDVNEAYRGRGYAGRACKLLLPVMRYHKMKIALITNNVTNLSSRRVCEKLGLRFLRQMDVPMENDMYKQGIRRVNIFAMEDK